MDELKDDKPSVFWKDKTFIFWALPILGSVLAIFFDYGYLHYFDIPAMYAEINFYVAALISFYLTLGFIGFIFVITFAEMLSKVVMYTLGYLCNLSPYFYVYYCFG